jgi:3-dehydroquinate dehydratase/shikimate dehydrogenase
MENSAQIASHLLRSRLGKICVALTGATADELIQKAESVLKETSFLEFRLDYLSQPTEALPKLKKFLGEHGAATVIATCRCKANGGRFSGSNAAALDVLTAAAAAGFQLVDIELESVEKLPKNTVETLRAAGAAVIISWHDFNATKDLETIYKRMQPFAPDFMKVVPTAKSLSDNLTLMRFLEKMDDRTNAGVVAICMGAAGIISRVLGLRAGSAFTFASATVGEETASGQIAARTLIEDYRVDQVDAATKVYGVAGNPIQSSLSPVMMNTAFRRETVNAVYLALQTSKVDDLFKLAKEVPIQGMSITMPLKRDIMPLLERSDPLSTKIGAVNTVLRAQDGKFYGFNTDVAGIVGPLERRLSLKGAKVLVLGAGGAARAAVFGCRDKGADVWILNRTPETAQKLAREAGAKTIKRDAVAKMGFDVILNATSVGMAGLKAAPLLEADDLKARVVFDLVYNPIETPLLRMARQKGIAVITGVEMFVTQGARQFEIWTGKPAPDQEMLRVVLHALRQGAAAGSETIDPAAPLQKLAVPAEPEEAAPVVVAAKVAKAAVKAVKAVAPAVKAVKPAAKAVPVVKKVVPAKKSVPLKKAVAKKAVVKKAVVKKAVPVKAAKKAVGKKAAKRR